MWGRPTPTATLPAAIVFFRFSDSTHTQSVRRLHLPHRQSVELTRSHVSMVRWLGIRARTTRRADVSARRAPAEEGGATQAFARAEARLPPPPARRRMTHGTRRAAAHREQCYALCIWGAGEGSRSATLLLSRSLRPRSAAGQALEGARGRGEHPGLAATLPTPQRRPSWMRRSFHSHHHPGLEGSVLLVCLEPRPITVRPALCVAPPARAPAVRGVPRGPGSGMSFFVKRFFARLWR